MFDFTKELGPTTEHPMQIRYMKLLSLSLNMLNCWPRQELGGKEFKYYVLMKYLLPIQSCILIPLIIAYISVHLDTKSFFELGHLYITALMTCVTLTRYTLPFFKKYRSIVVDFVKEFHLFHHKHRSAYALKTHEMVHKFSHFFIIYLTTLMFMGIILFNITPFYNTYSSGAFNSLRPENATYELAVYILLPFDYEHDFYGYIPMLLYNWYLSYYCSSAFCTIDMLLSLMVFHLWGHLKILKYQLENIPRPKSKVQYQFNVKGKVITAEADFYNPEEMVNVRKMLISYIDHHKIILRFNNNMSEVFGPVLFVYYAFHQISGCLLLLECSPMTPEALIRYGPLTIILFQQLIQLSVIFESIRTMSENLIQAVYDTPWECMDTQGRKIVTFFLFNVQTPISLKALGMTDVGVETMASILKTSFSYFTFLRSAS